MSKNKKQYSFSVIVPVYQVKNYISRCVSSLIAARDFWDPSKIEILLVDDCSTDGSGEICENLAKTYEDIFYFKCPHQGLSATRNFGLKEAKGEFICFVDGDDYVEVSYFSKLYEAFLMSEKGALKKQCELVAFNGIRVDENEQELWKIYYFMGLLGIHHLRKKDRAQFILEHFLQYHVGWEAWTFSYRRSFLEKHQLQFDENRDFAEDKYFNLRVFEKCKCFRKIEDLLYNYRKREGSIMNQKNEQEGIGFGKQFYQDTVDEFCKNFGDNLKKYYYNSCVSYYTKLYLKEHRKEELETILAGQPMPGKEIFPVPAPFSMGDMDLFRGIGLLIVMLGHTLVYFDLSSAPLPVLVISALFLYSIMNAFFIASGMGFRPKSMKDCIHQQAKYLLRPYVISVSIILVLYTLVQLVLGLSLKESVKAMLSFGIAYLFGIYEHNHIPMSFHGIKIHDVGTLWFVLAMMNSVILLNLCFQISSKKKRWAVILLMAIAGFEISKYGMLPFCLQRSLVYVLLLNIGYELKKKKVFKKQLGVFSGTLLLSLWILGAASEQLPMPEWFEPFSVLNLIGYASAGFLTLKLCLFFNRLEGYFTNKIRLLGKYSLQLYCIHAIEGVCLPWYKFPNHFGATSRVGMLSYLCLRLVLNFTLLYVFVTIKHGNTRLDAFLKNRKGKIKMTK